jgi:hypothetical protein
MLHGIFGKLGSGKGLLVMKYIAEELLNGFRDIVTSVPVRVLPWVNGQGIPQIGLRAYLAEEMAGILSEAELDNLLCRLLVKEKVEDGWDLFLWRRDGNTGEWFKLETSHPNEKGLDTRIDFEPIKGRCCSPCMVVTDEAWQFYPNNGGWSRSPILPFYARQQRKLRDEWHIVTQHPTDIDSVLWNITQDFKVCRNHGMERMGIFRQPEVFSVKVYRTNPAKGGAVLVNEEFHRLDKRRLAQCYDTTAGVGIVGGFKGDAGQKRKGLHIAWAFAGVVLLVVGLFLVPVMMGKGTGWFLKKAMAPVNPGKWSGIPVKTNGVQSTAVSAFMGASGVVPAAESRVALAVQKTGVSAADVPVPILPDYPTVAAAHTNELYCTGFATLGRTVTVFLSDGSTVDTDSGRIKTVAMDYVILDGVKLQVKRAHVYLPPASRQTEVETVFAEPAVVEMKQPRPAFGGVVLTPSVGGSH